MCIEIHTLRVRDNDTAPFLERMNPNAHLKVQDTRKCLIRAESDFVHFHAIVVSSPVPSRAMGNDN